MSLLMFLFAFLLDLQAGAKKKKKEYTNVFLTEIFLDS